MLNKESNISRFFYSILKNRVALHVFFWLAFILFYSFVYGSSYDNFSIKLFHTLLLMPVVLAASYFTMSVLIDRLLLKNQYSLFITLFIFSALGFTFLQLCMYYYFILPKLYPHADVNQVWHLGRFLIELLRLYAIVMLASALKLLRHWNRMKSVNNQLLEKNLRAELLIKDIEKQKVEAELNALKSQLNPHFLFNVLNSIYSHSILKSDTTPSIVLKLSDLMSYILYDCKTETVPLEKEIGFIRNYIELEKIRLEEDIEVNFNIKNISQAMIPPLLFVPLIENAFKHGVGSNPDNKCISLSISINDDHFHFNLKNSKRTIENGVKKEAKGGIGIRNVKKRLALLFPNQHEMKLTNDDDNFEVEINISKFSQKNL